MGKDLPFFPFYVGAWQKNVQIKSCSWAAKGVLIDSLCLMWECEERGVLATGNHPLSDKEWAMMLGGNTDVTIACIAELLDRGVLERNALGAAIYLPFLLLEEKKKKTKERVRKHRCNAGVTPNMKYENENEIKGLMEEEFEEEPIREIYYPKHFRNKPFLRVWSEWIHYRKARTKCPDPLTMFQKQILSSQKFSCEDVINALNEAMEKGWQGFFVEKFARNGDHRAEKAAREFPETIKPKIL